MTSEANPVRPHPFRWCRMQCLTSSLRTYNSPVSSQGLYRRHTQVCCQTTKLCKGYSISNLTSFSFCFIFFSIESRPIMDKWTADDAILINASETARDPLCCCGLWYMILLSCVNGFAIVTPPSSWARGVLSLSQALGEAWSLAGGLYFHPWNRESLWGVHHIQSGLQG